MAIRIESGDCLEVMPTLGVLVDSVVTDPPYHLTSIVKRFGKPDSAAVKVPENGTGVYARGSKGFMGKQWDGGDIAFQPETWAAVMAVMKPGAHLLAFGGTRTYARMAVAIEDAGFEVRDTVAWLHGVGFPKSHDVGKGIDNTLGAPRPRDVVPDKRSTLYGDRPWMNDPAHRFQSKSPVSSEAQRWNGWGTALKPAMELICFARKPLSEKTVAKNVLEWGCGGINIDGCRINANGQGGESGLGEADTRGCPVHGLRGLREANETMAVTSDEGQAPYDLRHEMPIRGDGGGKQPQLDGRSMDRRTPRISDVGNSAPKQDGQIAAADADPTGMLGASAGNGAEPQKGVAATRTRASHQRREGRQQNRKPRADGLGDPLQGTPASREGSVEAERGEPSLARCTCQQPAGRWPPNVTHDGSEEVLAGFPQSESVGGIGFDNSIFGGDGENKKRGGLGLGDSGSAARFFYTSKASPSEREGSKHPTVKPLDLMRWLVRLITPPGGTILDPFAGSGTTGVAAVCEGFDAILIEREPEYLKDIERRILAAQGEPQGTEEEPGLFV